jgi:DNA-binding response OmpR family regulator
MIATTILCGTSEMLTRELLRHALSDYGYNVITANTKQETMLLVSQRKPNLIILDTDLDLPLQGFDVCYELRGWCAAPILFLSSRGDKNTKVVALNLGADDYITRPFDVDELEARVRAALRRAAKRCSNILKG